MLSRYVEGAQFGRWTVLRRGERKNHVICRCLCGTEKSVFIGALGQGKSLSCGCYANEQRIRTDNKYRKWSPAEKYTLRSYSAMLYRCRNSACNGFERYGGRGISVCQRWLDSRDAFIADMGLRPKGYSLDRIDPNGDYTPSNCRWSSDVEQSNNKCNSRMLTIDGRTQSAMLWAREANIGYSTIKERLKRGWSPKEAVFGRVLRKGIDRYKVSVLPQNVDSVFDKTADAT